MHALPASIKRLPIPTRLGIAGLLIGLPLILGLVGFQAMRAERDPGFALNAGAFDLFLLVTTAIAGVIIMGVGIGIYAIILASKCFCGNLARPFFRKLKPRIFISQMVVTFFIDLGLGLLICSVVFPFTALQGIDPPDTILICIISVMVFNQIPALWIQIWAPLEHSLIIGRLRALGFAEIDLAFGRLIGISDPSRSSWRKLTLVEDDVGMLWIARDALIYMGDTQQFQ